MPVRPSRIRLVVRLQRSLAVSLLATRLASGQPATDSPAAEPPSPSPPSPSPPSAAAGLARVEDLYRATSFVDCVGEARRLLDPDEPAGVKRPTEIDRARTYLAACLIRSGDGAGGEREFAAAIRIALAENRAFPRPNSLVFSAAVVERYNAARRSLEAEIEAKRRAAVAAAEANRAVRDVAAEAAAQRRQKLLELAVQETVIVENRRWLAAMPFGVGQFQNRKPALGWTFLVSEMAALGVLVTGLTFDLALANRAVEEGSELTREEQRDLNMARKRARTAWVVALYGFSGLAAGGIAEAEANYVPSFTSVRNRPLPEGLLPPAKPAKPNARPRIELAPSAAGFGLGLAWQF